MDKKYPRFALTAAVLAVFALAGCARQNAIPALPAATAKPTSVYYPITVTETPLAETTPEGVEPDEDECGIPFYPVSDEATWTYSISSGGSAVHTMSADDFGKFTITIQGGDSTFTIDGQCTSEGLVIMDTPGASTTYSGEEGSATVSTVAVSGVTLPKDVGQGQQWSQTIDASANDNGAVIESHYTAVGFENISVPAGDFYALKVEQSGFVKILGHTVEMHGFHWYAEGVGVVRSAMDGAPVAELVSYDIPD